jgi:hypothetical protein
MWKLGGAAAAAAALACAAQAQAASERYVVVANGDKVGFINVDGDDRKLTIAYDMKINGRGPSSSETLELDARGLPVSWTVQGATTFGAPVGRTPPGRDPGRSGSRASTSPSRPARGPAAFTPAPC